jgi:hypothetical protein
LSTVLPLTLLVTGIALADDVDHAAAANDLALLANALYARANLHGKRLTLFVAAMVESESI